MTKERDALHMLSRDAGLTDIWRLTNPIVRDYTFFSHRHKTYSRIDFFLISSSLADSVKVISITDHS